MARGIAGKYPDLTIFHLPQRPTVLPGNTGGIVALFDKARLLEDQYPIAIAHLICHQMVVLPPHLIFVPHPITDKALHATDVGVHDLDGHRLNGFALEGTELAHHVVEKMLTRLTSGKTVMACGLERAKLIHEPFYIAGEYLERGNSNSAAFSPT